MKSIREIGIPINVYKTTLVEEAAVKEELVYINHQVLDGHIAIETRFFNSSGEIIKEDNIYITGEDYLLLMSESEVFAKGKQAGVFRDSDLWYLIDKIRGRK